MKIVLLTNIPAPYRIPVFDILEKEYKNNFIVIYSQSSEKNRNWEIPSIKHKHIFVKESNKSNSVFILLLKFKPKIIITAGFKKEMLVAFLFSKLFKKKHIVFTDSWELPTSNLSFLHKILRKIIIKSSNAFICVGIKGKKYLENYGANEEAIFISPLAINNKKFKKFLKEPKRFDIIYSGQFIERKMPYFFCNVVSEINKIMKNIRVLIIGSGPLEDKILNCLKEKKIKFYFPGFIQQEELPRYYASSKILLFPTKEDPWGIVANEACAVGTPVITCNNSGVANELIIDNYNGFVRPLDIEIWVASIMNLLNNNELIEKFSENCIKRVQKYSFKNAAMGIKSAIDYVDK